MRLILSILTLCLLSACATMPPVTTSANMCHFKIRELIVNDPRRSAVASTDTLGAPPPARSKRFVIPGPTLVLSGGSQHGAFGAGFLKRWAELTPDKKLPEFHLVTGISTGALLATWAFIREPETVAAEYLIKDESQLLKAYSRPSKGGTIGLGAALTLIRKNSLADLDPLRKRLRVILDHATLKKVADQTGRFVIGAVEIDTGNAVLFNMKDMARRATRNAPDSDKFAFYRNCYAEAIMASASVPLGAKPVFIDNRMYIDGGARYGVFVDYLSKVRADRDDEPDTETVEPETAATTPQPGTALPKAPQLFILVNGTQWVGANCSKIDATLCKDDLLNPDRVKNSAGAHKKWDIASLAFRSNDILVNQVYRFSAAHLQAQYREAYPATDYVQRFYFARIHRHDLNDAANFAFEGKSCRQWHDFDREKLNPFEFYPTYMRCLEAYGANQAEELRWYAPDTKSTFEADMAM